QLEHGIASYKTHTATLTRLSPPTRPQRKDILEIAACFLLQYPTGCAAIRFRAPVEHTAPCLGVTVAPSRPRPRCVSEKCPGANQPSVHVPQLILTPRTSPSNAAAQCTASNGFQFHSTSRDQLRLRKWSKQVCCGPAQRGADQL